MYVDIFFNVCKNIILSIKHLVDLFHEVRTVSLKRSQESKQQIEQQNQNSQPPKYVNLEVAKNCVKAVKEHEEIENHTKQVFVEILQLLSKPHVANIFCFQQLSDTLQTCYHFLKKNI